MKTDKLIHPEWLSTTVTRFYHYTMFYWRIAVDSKGAWCGIRQELELEKEGEKSIRPQGEGV